MASADAGSAVPVWLSEDDLGCIICQGLLSCPATLPCGHSFCRSCLERLWGAQGSRRGRICPTCREQAGQGPLPPKNTLLQDLVDKYGRALSELDADPRATRDAPAGPAPAPAPRRPPPPPAATQRSITHTGRELAKLMEQLIDITRRLQNQRSHSQSEAHNGPSTSDTTFSCGMDLTMVSSKLVTSNTSEGEIRDILHSLEEIQEKLQKNLMYEEALDEQTQGPIKLTFDLKSISHSLKVSEDGRTVTVSQPSNYRLSCEQFEICQVLCSQALSSGQWYWEVDTQHCSHWAIGVASWEMSRDTILGRTKDSWCVEWNGQLSAWHMAKEITLSSDRPGILGIQLDLTAGKLVFYAGADEKLLHEYSISAHYALHPAFWLYGLCPGNKLTLKQ
ncbi:E3 ubiquitin-protein ligase RNF135 [Rhynchocyon petersi]